MQTNLENVVGTNHQNWWFFGSRRCTSPNIMDNRCVLFQQAVLANDNRSGNGKNRDPWMNNTSAGNGDVTAEDAVLILADSCFGPDFKSVMGETNIEKFEITDMDCIYSDLELIVCFYISLLFIYTNYNCYN